MQKVMSTGKMILVMFIILSFALILDGRSLAFADDYSKTIDNSAKHSVGVSNYEMNPRFVAIGTHMVAANEIVNGKMRALARFTYYNSSYTAESTLVLEKYTTGSGWQEVSRDTMSFANQTSCVHQAQLPTSGSGTYRVKSYLAIYNGKTLVEQSTIYDNY